MMKAPQMRKRNCTPETTTTTTDNVTKNNPSQQDVTNYTNSYNNSIENEDREFLEQFLRHIDPDTKDQFDPDSFDGDHLRQRGQRPTTTRCDELLPR